MTEPRNRRSPFVDAEERVGVADHVRRFQLQHTTETREIQAYARAVSAFEREAPIAEQRAHLLENGFDVRLVHGQQDHSRPCSQQQAAHRTRSKNGRQHILPTDNSRQEKRSERDDKKPSGQGREPEQPMKGANLCAGWRGAVWRSSAETHTKSTCRTAQKQSEHTRQSDGSIGHPARCTPRQEKTRAISRERPTTTRAAAGQNALTE